MKKVILIIITLLITSAIFLSSAADGDSQEVRILMISSYSPSFMTFFDQIFGVKSLLEDINYVLDVEFMDSKRFYTEENFKNFTQNLEYKLKNSLPYDIIVTADDNAINFVMENKDTYFINTPILFLGVNNKENAKKYAEDDYVTGVIEEPSIKDTIELALDLLPKARKVYAIVDSTPSGQGDLTTFLEQAKYFEQLEFEVIDTSYLSFNAFDQTLQRIEKDDIVLLLSLYVDKNEVRISFKEGLEHILDHINTPVFHPYQHGIGEGLIGGKVISHYEQGRYISQMILNLVNGQDIATLKLINESPNKSIIDYKILQAFNLNKDALPTNVELINYSPTLLEEYGLFILTFLMIIVIELIIIISLILNIKKRHHIEKELLEKNKEIYQKNEAIQIFNKTLEDKVTERTTELELAMDHLKNAQDRLVKKETLLSFSKLSNKINHMINTPLGIAFTDTTYMIKSLKDLENHIKSERVSKSTLSNLIAESQDCIENIQSSIRKSIMTLEEMKRFSTYNKTDYALVYDSTKLLTHNLKQNSKFDNVKLQFEYQNIIKIHMHEMILNRILYSLVENAVDFNPDKDLTITILFLKEADQVKIIIEDDGKGIPKDEQDKIFQPYYSTSPHKIGMGLFIIETIIYETYQGKFYLDPTYEKGCRFVITMDASEEFHHID
ncbi:MAG: hypothetical protein JXR88_00825 [Clostridia bacterium]|nr:hypothetical protein [Clostridia bacterium]